MIKKDRRVVLGIAFALVVAVLALVLLNSRDDSPTIEAITDAEPTDVQLAEAPLRPARDTRASATPTDEPTLVPPTHTPTPTAEPKTQAQAVVVLPSATPSPTFTPKPTATETRTPRPTHTPRPSATSTHTPLDCLNAVYLADVTIPDNSHLDKAEAFVKTWRVRNSGSCDWPQDAQLAFASGHQMNAPDSVTVGPLAAGETAEISIEMVAPDADDYFEGTWRFVTQDGANFGTYLTVVIQVGEPPTPAPTATPDPAAPAPPPPPPPPGGHIGGSFELGGHVANFGNSALMHHAGMTWAKVQLHHGTDASNVVNEAHANGLKILIGAVGDASRAADPGYQEEFAGWLGTVAATGADAIEVWNEPNIDREWAQGQIDPAAYTEMLRRAYTAIKNNNPGTMVVSAALSPTWHNPPFHWGDDVYLGGMVAAGAASYVDCYGIHYNSGTVPPSQTSGAITGDHYSWYFWGMINTYWNASGGTRPLCFTELGYLSGEGYCELPGNFAWANATTVAQQAAWLAEAAVLASGSGKLRLMIIWNVNFTRFDCGPGNGDPQAGYGIIRPGGGCPACDTLHNVTH